MKAKTQIQAITEALVNGEKISALTSFKEFGSLRLASHIFVIQKRHGIRLNRKDIKGKTRYGTTFVCTEYSMNRTDARLVKKAIVVAA